MDIRKNRNLLIVSLIITIIVCSTIAQPNSNNYFIRIIFIAIVIFCYYKLHFSMYFNYPRSFFMCVWVFFGLMLTRGILGISIIIYCVYNANKMLKNFKTNSNEL